jgi:ABC-type multidrug transport system fused ATPase/permease subunit
LELQFSIDVDPQVTFLYPSRPKHTILKGLNLTIPAKKLTCIMGPSGCGKSTVMSLLMRLYEPLTGSITLDGINIVSLDIQFLRSIIGYVQQEPVSCGSNSRVQALLLHFRAVYTSFVFRFCSRGA